jgi:cytochrome c-type biogenesis protein CcmH/NrfG
MPPPTKSGWFGFRRRSSPGICAAPGANCRNCLSALPGDPRIYNLLGVIDAQENNFTAAESNFQRAIQLAPRFTGAYLNLGRFYQEHANQKGGMEKALKGLPDASGV